MTEVALVLQNLRRAFQYHWRLWTIPELHDMLMGAGFSCVNVWLRPMQARRPSHILRAEALQGTLCLMWPYSSVSLPLAGEHSSHLHLSTGATQVLTVQIHVQGVSSECKDEEGEEGSSDSGEHDEDFEEYNVKTFSPKTSELLSKGWTAFVIGVAEPQ